jgi:hypothetical protein
VECPVATLCEARSVVGSLHRHHVVPRTSRGGAPFSEALETAWCNGLPRCGERRLDRTCRLRRFRSERAIGWGGRSGRTSSEGALSGSALGEGRDESLPAASTARQSGR